MIDAFRNSDLGQATSAPLRDDRRTCSGSSVVVTQSHRVCLLKGEGRSVSERDFAHGAAGLTDLHDWLIEKTNAWGRIAAAIEIRHGRRGGDASRSRLPSSCHQRASCQPRSFGDMDDRYPAFAFSPVVSIPATAQASSLSDVSPLTPTAPSNVVPSMISTPPGTGTIRPCASVFTALTK
jgi:hypothetical protein